MQEIGESRKRLQFRRSFCRHSVSLVDHQLNGGVCQLLPHHLSLYQVSTWPYVPSRSRIKWEGETLGQKAIQNILTHWILTSDWLTTGLQPQHQWSVILSAILMCVCVCIVTVIDVWLWDISHNDETVAIVTCANAVFSISIMIVLFRKLLDWSKSRFYVGLFWSLLWHEDQAHTCVYAAPNQVHGTI